MIVPSAERPDYLAMTRKHIQFVASEIYPLGKTGGLADVCAALPAALTRLGSDVRLVMPAYQEALDLADKPHVAAFLDNVLGFENVRIIAARTPDSGLPVNLIDIPSLYRDGGGIYQNADGSERNNNAIRFAALSQAAAQLATGQGGSAWRPDIVHCHDWHTGLLPLMLQQIGGQRAPATVFTVHNMAFQGLFPWGQYEAMGLPQDDRLIEALEFYGQFSFLKAGLNYADYLTTVSPTYAEEIQTPEYGCGFDGLLRSKLDRLSGILNGIDADFWSPSQSKWIASSYSQREASGKRQCKRDLQSELGLVVDPQAPLMIFIGRLTEQKMADVLRTCLPTMLAREPDRQFALLGQGDAALEEDFRVIARDFPGRVSIQTDYTEKRAHRLHAGGDILIHGSRFEPCGLTQLYAMRFGVIPVIRRVGGLADTVIDATEKTLADGTATGFHFTEPTAEAMLTAIERAVQFYRQPLAWRRLQLAAMSCDFNWERSAQQYLDIYNRLVPSQGEMDDTTQAREIA